MAIPQATAPPRFPRRSRRAQATKVPDENPPIARLDAGQHGLGRT
ncbi:hypothetical protein [Herbidospora sp. RD11066]